MAGIAEKQTAAIPDIWSWRTWSCGQKTWSQRKQSRRNLKIPWAKDDGVKTTISRLSSLEHDILEWAINSELFEDIERAELSGWSSWDRTGVLTQNKLVIDWDTPPIATYAELILQRLQGLSEGSNDKYA